MSGGHYPSYNHMSTNQFYGSHHTLPSMVPSGPSCSYNTFVTSSGPDSNSSWMNHQSYPPNFNDNSLGMSPPTLPNYQPDWTDVAPSNTDGVFTPQINIFSNEEQRPIVKPSPMNGSMSKECSKYSKIVNGIAKSSLSPKQFKECNINTINSDSTTNHDIKYDGIVNFDVSSENMESVLKTMLTTDNMNSVPTLQQPKLDECIEKFSNSSSPENITSTLTDECGQSFNLQTLNKTNGKLKTTESYNLNSSENNKLEADIDHITFSEKVPSEEGHAPLQSEIDTRTSNHSLSTESRNFESMNQSVSNNPTIDEIKPRFLENMDSKIKEIFCVEAGNESKINFEGVKDAKHENSPNSAQSLPIYNIESNVNCSTSNSPALKNNQVKSGPSSVSTPLSMKTNKRNNYKNSKPKNPPKKSKARSSTSAKDNSVIENTANKRVPVIHIEGSKENPTSVQIINSIKLDDDDSTDNKVSAKKKPVKNDRAHKRITTDYVLKNYDPGTSDSSWICIFCKLSAHAAWSSGESSGDLFGPYFIKDSSKPQKDSKQSDPSDPIKKKQKRSKLSEHDHSDSHSPEEKSIEIWAHENCFIWAPGLHLIGSKLIGLEEAVLDASNTTCTHCGENGATISCKTRHCKNVAHFNCACHNNWNLDKDSFISICNIHKVNI